MATRSDDGVKLADQVYELLERAIVTGDLRAGNFLSEPDIVRRTGFGRTPVREAVQRLERNQLVAILPYRGAFVAELNYRDQLEVFEIRRELDTVVGSIACCNADDTTRQEFEKLAGLLRSTRELADGEAVIEIDARFRKHLLQACGNPLLTRALEPIDALSRRILFRVVSRPCTDMLDLYAESMEAVAARDPSQACASAMKFLRAFEVLARRSIG